MIFLSNKAISSPKLYSWLPALLSLLMVILVALPTFSPTIAQYLSPLTIDADPENMLFYDDPERVFNRQQKQTFSLNDLLVVGVVNTNDENGVFNKETLAHVYDLTEFAKSLQWQGMSEDGQTAITEGVISVDLIAPSTVDNIEQGGPGAVKFDWLMSQPPATQAAALKIRDKALNQPLLNGSLVSENGKAIALYIPITSKGLSYKITGMLQDRIDSYAATEEFHITGLPVAQDTFAVEMFIQMGTITPIAMLLIFALLWYFFRNLTLIISPLLVAMASVTLTVGLLVVSGNNIHIMSSMIPVFIMSIAILDAIHILSEFYDRYPEFNDKKKTIKSVMAELAMPMLFTTLTTAVGFFSLNLTPLPPIQVFGTFIGIGVVLAWFFTMTFIPAYILLMPEHKFSNFGMKKTVNNSEDKSPLLARILTFIGVYSQRYAKTVLVITAIILAVSLYGTSKIVTNDNLVKWFEEDHKIRVADKTLNEMFGGTYMSYLSLKSNEQTLSYDDFVSNLQTKLANHEINKINLLAHLLPDLSKQTHSKAELMLLVSDELEMFSEDESLDKATELESALWALAPKSAVFKDPDVLNYMSGLQTYLKDTGFVGKSNSLVQIVKTVHRELYTGQEVQYRIPDKSRAVAQTLITFQNSHRPQDLWHYVTPDYSEANIWLQLKSGDNKDVKQLEESVAAYFSTNPPPRALQQKWFGLNHINITWQEQIVTGMAKALGGSFIVVLIMMVLLFRSVLWGILAMIPLSFSIAVLYGIVGLIGKDYDAPIATLSALILGLTVDYAIHFLSRSRSLYEKYQNWPDTIQAVYGEPARAISRNVIIMGIGFLPLILAPLIPYKVVGIFISSILVFAGIATLVILPALMSLLEKILFKDKAKTPSLTTTVGNI